MTDFELQRVAVLRDWDELEGWSWVLRTSTPDELWEMWWGGWCDTAAELDGFFHGQPGSDLLRAKLYMLTHRLNTLDQERRRADERREAAAAQDFTPDDTPF